MRSVPDDTPPALPMSARWESAVVASSIAAVSGGAALVGRWPLVAMVLLIQLGLTLAWLALTDVPAASGGLVIIVGSAVAVDFYASRGGPPDQSRVAAVVAAAFVLAVLRQLARRRRSAVTESLAVVVTGVLMVVFAGHLIASRVIAGGIAAAAAICFAIAAATATRRGVDALYARPALRTGSGRGWPAFVLSIAAGAATGAYVGAARTGIETRTGALIGLAAALAAAIVDLGIGIGSLHLADGRQRSAIVPLVVLLPLVVAAPVGYGVARLLAE